ncbi:hypothetical protein [Winogradskyella pulchriflava]|uniref:Uncharacterized protein n=1 Tax=Winogradskyella pulchriflava TaxID=1110688 RepID=A0ABV6Q4M5_9FLAO
MATSKFFTLKEAKLNNNCPECYSNDGLQLTFKQKFTENALYKAITNETSHEMFCANCNTDIFPVRWTDDIEQVVAYHERAVQPKPKSIKLKSLAWILIVVDAMLLTFVILVATGVITF